MNTVRAAFAATAVTLFLPACTSLGDVPNERLGSAAFSLANGIPAGTAQLIGSGDTVTLAVAVTADSAHDDRKICPPPSPCDPSIVIMGN